MAVIELRGDLIVLGDVRRNTRGKLVKTSRTRVKKRSKTLQGRFSEGKTRKQVEEEKERKRRRGMGRYSNNLGKAPPSAGYDRPICFVSFARMCDNARSTACHSSASTRTTSSRGSACALASERVRNSRCCLCAAKMLSCVLLLYEQRLVGGREVGEERETRRREGKMKRDGGDKRYIPIS